MRKLAPFLLFFGACSVNAQTATPPAPIGADPTTLASRQLEFLTRSVRDANQPDAREAAALRDERLARLLFWQKANHFVALWGDFATRLNEQQTFDAKLAKKLSRAFHELEASDGWPIRQELKTK